MDVEILWDLDHDEHGNVRHIAEHGIAKNDVARVFDNPVGFDTSDTSGRPIVFATLTMADTSWLFMSKSTMTWSIL